MRQEVIKTICPSDMRLKLKPLSVNEAWKGRRKKTDKYIGYTLLVKSLLKPLDIPDGELVVTLTFGFSSRGGDVDNPVKCFIDILSKYYGFNDNRIVEMHLRKIVVDKGGEFINFDISAKADF